MKARRPGGAVPLCCDSSRGRGHADSVRHAGGGVPERLRDARCAHFFGIRQERNQWTEGLRDVRPAARPTDPVAALIAGDADLSAEVARCLDLKPAATPALIPI